MAEYPLISLEAMTGQPEFFRDFGIIPFGASPPAGRVKGEVDAEVIDFEGKPLIRRIHWKNANRTNHCI